MNIDFLSEDRVSRCVDVAIGSSGLDAFNMGLPGTPVDGQHKIRSSPVPSDF